MTNSLTIQFQDCCRNLKAFNAKYKLITHMRVHTKEKPYLCTVSLTSLFFHTYLNTYSHSGSIRIQCLCHDLKQRSTPTSPYDPGIQKLLFFFCPKYPENFFTSMKLSFARYIMSSLELIFSLVLDQK